VSSASRSIAVVIPVLNERDALPLVIGDLPRKLIDELIVVDKGSTDGSADVARGLGARVVDEPCRGYGAACLAGIAAAGDVDVIAFIDGDRADHTEQLPRVVEPLLDGRADLVVGSRAHGRREGGSMPAQARFGNWLAAILPRRLYAARHTDLGPFRAIRRDALDSLGMCERNCGWTVELQIKAAQAGLRVVEVPVEYRRRLSRSKISATVRGTVAAGTKLLYSIARRSLLAPRASEASSAHAGESEGERVSVIVPTLDEERSLPRCLESLELLDEPFEVVVVDAGSSDATARIAESHPRVRLIHSPRGRARQMNAGAREARGRFLWFLHADCTAPAGALPELRRVLADERVALGAFRFVLDARGAIFRLVELGVRLRCIFRRTPYGDQGLFVRRDVFESIGGFEEIPILEDVRFVRSARKLGEIRVVDLPLVTSARRWRRAGVVRTIARHQLILLLDRLGVSPARLASLRPHVAEGRQASHVSDARRESSPESGDS
jgi:rSAM/selenodomain-associated transferase 2